MRPKNLPPFGNSSRRRMFPLMRVSCVFCCLAAAVLPPARSEPKVAPAAKTIRILPGPTAAEELQAALIDIEPGQTIELAEGVYDCPATLTLDVPRVTLRGAGPEATRLNFAGLLPGSGGEGLLATANDFTLEDLAVENSQGDAIKVHGADGVTFRRVRVEWTRGAHAENGSYGFYPVLCKNVLVEDCEVRGASDAGVYVGQSRDVIVRRNYAHENVAGIEIENCIGADVHDNRATNNAAGILAFTLPDLVEKQGRGCRIFSNNLYENNHENFAPKGNIVSQAPSGTGIMVLANDDVEIFDNDLRDNAACHVLIISYMATGHKFTDSQFDPYAENIFLHDNRFAGGGDKPTGELAAIKLLFGKRLPDILCDAAQDERKFVAGKLPSELGIHARDNGAATLASIDLSGFFPKIIRQAAPSQDPPRERQPEIVLRATPSAGGESLPKRTYPLDLAEWKLFEGDGSTQRPQKGVAPYDLNSPLFSDYTNKHRFVRLPSGEPATYRDDDVFDFPVGTVISKTFAMPHDLRDPAAGERLLETRLLIREPEGWIGLPYIWNDSQTSARLRPAGGTARVEWKHFDGSLRTNNYLIPNVNDCKRCHKLAGGMAPLGPSARQLNREFAYGRGAENQLAHWSRAGLLKNAPAPEQAPRMAVWNDAAASTLAERARAWLEVNCAHCHRPDGAANNAGLDLRTTQTDPVKYGIQKPPVAAGNGSGGLKYDIVPGRPDESILVFRLASTHPDVMMPELGKRLVHDEGLALIREWIEKMNDQP